MPSPYDQIIEELAQDPDFLNLNPSDQDQLVNELAQERFGKIPNTENFIQNAIRVANEGLSQGAKMAVENFPPFSGQPETMAELLPSMSQLTGSTAGFLLGAPRAAPFRGQVLGGTLGRAGGELGRQMILTALGEKAVDPQRLAIQTGTAAGTEALGGAIGKGAGAVFSGTAGKFFRGQTGKRLAQAFENVQKGDLSKSASELYVNIQNRLDNLFSKVPIQPSQQRMLRSSVNDIFETVEKKGSEFKAEDLLRAKKRIDQFLKKIGVFTTKGKSKPITDYDVGDTALEIRGIFSDELKSMANRVSPKVGKEFSKASQAFSKTAKEFPPGKMGIGGIVPEIGRSGAFFKFASGDIGGALGSLAGAEAAEARGLPVLGYSIAQALSKGAPTAANELVSFIQKQRK